jgi:CRP/FNR family transcriptional regulator, anaerobic regulatory protein
MLDTKSHNMADELLVEIKKVIDVSEEGISLFMQSFEEKFIPKGDFFLKEGQVSKHFGYIKSGLMMYYKIVDGIENAC